MDKKTIKQLSISILIVVILVGLGYFLLTKKTSDGKTTIDVKEISDINTTDPVKTASKFIQVNGTMGNIEKDITQESMKTNEATYRNGNRRLKSLEEVEKAVIPGNQLIMGNERDNIKNYVRDLDYPFLYEVRNIKASEPSKIEKITIHSDTGLIEYKSVKVKVDFDSARVFYSCPKDVTYDGIHREITNIEHFENIEVVLVQSGDLWFIYDIPNAEKIVNERFATWSGASPAVVNYEKNTETGVFKIKDFVPEVFDTPLENETLSGDEEKTLLNQNEVENNGE